LRSITYLTLGKPSCFADCIDCRDTHVLSGIQMELRREYVACESMLVYRLSGAFTWDFDTGPVHYEESFGGILMSERESRRKKSVDNANRRVDRRMHDFELFDLDVAGKHERFLYDVSDSPSS
jgi:hypothetical protein